MKKLLLLVLLISSAVFARAQIRGSGKLYAFRQAVLPGARQNIITEGGQEIQGGSGSSYNYFIYLETAARVYPAEIWINGEQFSVSMNPVNQTPVKRTMQSGEEVELVPATSGRVIMLQPAPYVEIKNTGNYSNIASTNAVVVVYRQNGRFVYTALKDFSELETAAMQ